ncbi:MAG: M28 family peptidase [Bacteroidetes bacterium]|jgi:Zn-dependent M28 family amino/carboxypeptidase|nr:M28 family peptidase [Bacteroidota bacterium]MBP9795800.1 M28 family peptidase [Chitinophagales bacterium]
MRSVISILLIIICSLSNIQSFSQNVKEQELKAHVVYLADDKLEGRATGSAGEKLASDYIAEEFRKMGLKPAGDANTYLQAFDAHSGKKPGENNYILAENKWSDLLIAFPHPMSANGIVTARLLDVNFGITAAVNNYDDYANVDAGGKIVLVQLSSPDGTHPHSKYIEFNDERSKIKNAIAHGAAAVIFYNIDSNYQSPVADYRRNTAAENIPVYYVENSVVNALKNYKGSITISVELLEQIRTGHNIAGFIDNKATNTVIIGAHYDHLGHGEIEGSLYRGEPAIHNGADDNASGVSLIIELAEKLKSSNLKNNNYLIIAFSGEEMGLFGSKAYVNSDAMKNYTPNYMLNFDMVGRLDSTKTIIINGVGSSTNFSVLKNINESDIKIVTTESGIGPSDQTSFYLKDIPVLHFFTGSHSDYHKPGDDADKVNYSGIKNILDYTYVLIDSLNSLGKINFTKTKEDNNDNTPRFTVTMGVIPDYVYSGKGMRIDGVSDGKPAQKAGIMAGDIVLKLGEYEIVDMMAYMQALGKLKKGDKTVVVILRNETQMELPIQF